MKYLHTMIRVTDPAKTIAFFELLGLKEARRLENEQGRFTLIFLSAPGDESAEVELRTTGIRKSMAKAAISAISPTASTISTRPASGSRTPG